VNARFYSIKDEIRIIGFDDAPFQREDRSVLVVGAVYRGGGFMDGVVSTEVEVDGLDSTEKLSELLNNLRFGDVRIVMIDGIAFGGFNVVDIKSLNEATDLPVIVVTRDMPDFDGIWNALKHTQDPKKRRKLIEDAGEPMFVETAEEGGVYIQFSGINFDDAAKIVRMSSTHSLIPEPIRAAHLIAQGVSIGQSKGRA
jgi:hypothetical protein